VQIFAHRRQVEWAERKSDAQFGHVCFRTDPRRCRSDVW
jgi:hypothetical protein